MKLPDGVTEIPGPDLGGRKYPHRDLTEKIIGCAIAVHKELQAGYVEAIYENALAHELRKSGFC
ncbi:MAG: GxxExxY protein [Phycisphaerae bacterium]